MLPLLHPGEEILVARKFYCRETPRVGDVVVVKQPDQPSRCLVKRVLFVRADGACFVQGDNYLQSTDSWSFGWIDPQLIVGRVTSRFL